MKKILIALIIVALGVYLFLVLAVEDDKKFFHRFKDGFTKPAADIVKEKTLHDSLKR